MRVLELGERLAVGEKNLCRSFVGGFADIADARRERDQDQRVEQEAGRDDGQRDGDAAPGGVAQVMRDSTKAGRYQRFGTKQLLFDRGWQGNR